MSGQFSKFPEVQRQMEEVNLKQVGGLFEVQAFGRKVEMVKAASPLHEAERLGSSWRLRFEQQSAVTLTGVLDQAGDRKEKTALK